MSESRRDNRVYIALGSNINAADNLPAAVRLLGNHGTVAEFSTVYETLPVAFHDQPNFLNAAVLLETGLDVNAVFEIVVPDVENALHRVRDPDNRNGPRTIDLDVALFNELVIQFDGHELPDPDIETRPFVGIPLAEIAPDYIHPIRRKTLAQLAEGFEIVPGDMLPRTDVVLL